MLTTTQINMLDARADVQCISAYAGGWILNEKRHHAKGSSTAFRQLPREAHIVGLWCWRHGQGLLQDSPQTITMLAAGQRRGSEPADFQNCNISQTYDRTERRQPATETIVGRAQVKMQINKQWKSHFKMIAFLHRSSAQPAQAKSDKALQGRDQKRLL